MFKIKLFLLITILLSSAYTHTSHASAAKAVAEEAAKKTAAQCEVSFAHLVKTITKTTVDNTTDYNISSSSKDQRDKILNRGPDTEMYLIAPPPFLGNNYVDVLRPAFLFSNSEHSSSAKTAAAGSTSSSSSSSSSALRANHDSKHSKENYLEIKPSSIPCLPSSAAIFINGDRSLPFSEIETSKVPFRSSPAIFINTADRSPLEKVVVDKDVHSIDERTAFWATIRKDNGLEYLLARKLVTPHTMISSVTEGDFSLLYWAIAYNQFDNFKMLIKYVDDIHKIDRDTILLAANHLAANNLRAHNIGSVHPQYFKVLLDKRLDPNLRLYDASTKATYSLTEYTLRRKAFPKFSMLLAYGAQLDRFSCDALADIALFDHGNHWSILLTEVPLNKQQKTQLLEGISTRLELHKKLHKDKILQITKLQSEVDRQKKLLELAS